MEHKQYRVQIKQVGDEPDRTLRFIGSDESVDRDGDIIDVAGWDTDDYMKNPVVLWAHNRGAMDLPPIGKTVNLNKDIKNKQLVFDIKFPTLAELSTDAQNASDHAKFVDTIYNMCKNNYLNAVSVGFRGLEYKQRDDDAAMELPEWQRGTHYMEQELFEISICPVPANPNALQTAKSKGLIDDYTIKSFFYTKTQKGVIPFHPYQKADESTPWNAAKEVGAANVDDLKKMCAWYDSAHVDVKSAYKLPHHQKDGYRTVWKGVVAAMAALLGSRGGVDIPESDKKAVYNHLAKHYKEFDKTPPDYKLLSESEVKVMTEDEKSGVRLSDDSKKALADIHKSLTDTIASHKEAHKGAVEPYKAIAGKLDGDTKSEMQKAIDAHEKAHKSTVRAYKSCADKLLKFIDPSAVQQSDGDSDGVERALDALTEQVKTLNSILIQPAKKPEAKEIDLSSISGEQISEAISDVLEEKLKAAKGKV